MPRVISRVAPEKRKPKLGQHFLADESAAVQIVDALGDVSHRTVFEIGPGKGVLTSMLAKRAHRLIAVELDRVLAAQLRMEFGQSRNVEIIEGDVLAVDLNTIFGPRPGTTRTEEESIERVTVVGNIPYYITSDLLLRLFEHRNYVESLVLMVQREVADRLAAASGGSEYGLLSRLLNSTRGSKNCSPFHREHFLLLPKCTRQWCGLPLNPGWKNYKSQSTSSLIS